jgi:hypothetical protein
VQLGSQRFEQHASNVEECSLDTLVPQWLHIHPCSSVIMFANFAAGLK